MNNPDHFILKQDWRIEGPVCQNLSHSDQINNTNEIRTIYVKDKTHYPDFIQSPKWLIRDKLKNIFAKSQPDLRIQGAVLTEEKNNRQELYWLIEPPALDCLSEQTHRYKDNTIKKIILDPKKVQGQNIFCLQGLPKVFSNYLIISLDIAESILCREPWGIQLEKIEKER